MDPLPISIAHFVCRCGSASRRDSSSKMVKRSRESFGRTRNSRAWFPEFNSYQCLSWWHWGTGSTLRWCCSLQAAHLHLKISIWWKTFFWQPVLWLLQRSIYYSSSSGLHMQNGVEFIRSQWSQALCSSLRHVWKECSHHPTANASSSSLRSYQIWPTDWFPCMAVHSIRTSPGHHLCWTETKIGLTNSG